MRRTAARVIDGVSKEALRIFDLGMDSKTHKAEGFQKEKQKVKKS